MFNSLVNFRGSSDSLYSLFLWSFRLSRAVHRGKEAAYVLTHVLGLLLKTMVGIGPGHEEASI